MARKKERNIPVEIRDHIGNELNNYFAHERATGGESRAAYSERVLGKNQSLINHMLKAGTRDRVADDNYVLVAKDLKLDLGEYNYLLIDEYERIEMKGSLVRRWLNGDPRINDYVMKLALIGWFVASVSLFFMITTGETVWVLLAVTGIMISYASLTEIDPWCERKVDKFLHCMVLVTLITLAILATCTLAFL